MPQELTPNSGGLGGQSQLQLFPVKEAEVDGVQMGVFSDGTPYLTERGLARMCGVRHGVIQRLRASMQEAPELTRNVTIRDLLLAQGHTENWFFIKIPDRGAEAVAYPDSVCMAILEYYAFESTQADNDTALTNFRFLARSSFRAYIYNRCGFDPNKHIPESWRNFHERIGLNDQVPAHFFSIFRELADIVVHIIQSGCPIDDHTVPDISVGKMWSTHWEASDLQSKYGARQKHPHNYPDWFPQSAVNPVPAWIYPVSALGVFRVWLYDTYIPVNFPKYVEGKVKKSVFLPSRAEMLLGAVNRKELGEDPSPLKLPPPEK